MHYPDEAFDDLFPDLFNDNDPPDQEFVLGPRPPNKPSRTQQLFQQVATEADQDGEPNEFETPEWEEDFDSKALALRDAFQQTVTEELYIELFGSLESKCHVLADERKATARSFYELESLIQEHDDVFLYNQEFQYKDVDPLTGKTIWYPKTYDALIGFRCFVVDIDHVDAGNIRSVIEMIKSRPILPNYINLTGNGLHLYFLFDAFHDMKHCAWLMAYDNRTKAESEREVYVTIKQGMISWFKRSSAKADVQNHLAQPSRLPGSKTKNRNKRTILFKVSDTKHSIQHIAGLLRIDLPNEERIQNWKKEKQAERRRKKKAEKGVASRAASLQDLFDLDEPKPVLTVVDIDGDSDVAACEPCVNMGSRFRFSFEGLAQRIQDDWESEVNSPRAVYFAEQKKLWAEKKARAATPEGQKRRVAQRRGLESQYQQFKEYCRTAAQCGKRELLLHIFWNHAPWYQKDQGVIQRDYDDLFLLCNSLHRSQEVTKEQYDGIVYGPRYQYTKERISELLGVELKFKNKKNDELQRNRDANSNMWKRIYVICETVLENNPRCSWKYLLNTVNSYGIEVSEKTLRTRPEIRELKSRMRSRYSYISLPI